MNKCQRVYHVKKKSESLIDFSGKYNTYLRKLTFEVDYSLLECAKIKHDLAHHLSTLPIFFEMFIQVFPLSQTFFTISKLLSYVSKNEYTGSTLLFKTFHTNFIQGPLKKWTEQFIFFLKLRSRRDPNYTVVVDMIWTKEPPQSRP